MDPIYISFATLKTNYVEIIESGLIPSLKRFNLPYDVVYLPSLHNWVANTRMKAQVIYDMLLKHKRPVVWIDADGVVKRLPTLFDSIDCDLAFHTLDTMLFWHKKEGHSKRETLTGTLYVNYNDKTLEFIRLWMDMNRANPDKNDMQNFALTLAKSPSIKVYDLPIQYTTIVNFQYKVPKEIADPCIVHMQASRLNRNRV